MNPMKFVLIGDGAVGKQCFAIRCANGTFFNDYVPTVFEIFFCKRGETYFIIQFYF